MKKILLTLLFCALVSGRAVGGWDFTSRPYKERPSLGMTQAQVLARYGEPYQRAASEAGPHWYYHLKFGEVYGREYVPFYLESENVYLGIIYFDSKGKVDHLDWRHSVAR